MCALRFSGPARFIFCNRLMKPVDYKIARATSTVNEKEVKHHSNLKDIWWNEQLFSLHAFNPLRVEFIRKGLANVGFKEQTPSLPLQGVKIIDVGCAGGILTESLARIGAQMTGIDPSEELIDVAKEHITLSPNILQRVNYIHTTIEEFSPTNEKQYDVVVASEVIEHVQNYKLFLQECLKVLKPGGSIFLTAPNKTLMSWLTVIILAEYVFKSIPLGTHDWNQFIHCNELQRTLESYGCTTMLVHGIMHNPLTKQWFFSSNSQMMYAIHAVKNTNIKQ